MTYGIPPISSEDVNDYCGSEEDKKKKEADEDSDDSEDDTD